MLELVTSLPVRAAVASRIGSLSISARLERGSESCSEVATAAVVTDEAVATAEKQEDAKVTELAVKEITMPENTYQATGPTAEALAVIFMGVCLMICWIECCK